MLTLPADIFPNRSNGSKQFFRVGQMGIGVFFEVLVKWQ